MKRLALSLALWLGLVGSSFAVVQATNVGDAAYTMLNTDTNISTTTAFTASRTWTLPYAGGTCIGQNCTPAANQLVIFDAAGGITSTNTLVIAPQSGETINGNAANLILTNPKVKIILVPTSSTNWQATTTGDFVSSTVLTASAVSLTSNTPANVTSQSLSQGDYDCRATVSRNLNASTSVTRVSASISTTSATMGTQGVNAVDWINVAANVMGATGTDNKILTRVNLTATTTVYLVANDVFTVSTDAVYGVLSCRRVY